MTMTQGFLEIMARLHALSDEELPQMVQVITLEMMRRGAPAPSASIPASTPAPAPAVTSPPVPVTLSPSRQTQPQLGPNFRYYAIVPKTNSGKTAIEPQYIRETQGKRRYLQQANPDTGILPSGAKDFSVCMNDQEDICRQGENCHQLHVQQQWYTEFKARVKCTCCAVHGDFAANAEWKTRTQGCAFILAGLPRELREPDHKIDVGFLARTQGLEKKVQDRRSNIITIYPRDICRKHIRDECRFGPDCCHVHVCRSISSNLPLKDVPSRKPEKANENSSPHKTSDVFHRDIDARISHSAGAPEQSAVPCTAAPTSAIAPPAPYRQPCESPASPTKTSRSKSLWPPQQCEATTDASKAATADSLIFLPLGPNLFQKINEEFLTWHPSAPSSTNWNAIAAVSNA